ncbi:unnamed protein product [Rhizophagus irregularis]|nr:unnamed protein product [Rhizophagus irregularis]
MNFKKCALKNEWRNDVISQVGSNRFSSASRSTTGKRSEYDDEQKCIGSNSLPFSIREEKRGIALLHKCTIYYPMRSD